MKETPLLFKAEMVRALLDGRKKQTRRVVKPQPFALYRLTDDRVETIHTDDDHQIRSKIKADSNFSKLGLHGRGRWEHLFENTVCRLREEKIRGLVSFSWVQNGEGIPLYIHVPPRQEGDSIGSQIDLSRVSRSSSKKKLAGPASRRESGKQSSQEFAMGHTEGQLAGSQTTLPSVVESDLQIQPKGARARSLGSEKGPLQSETCRIDVGGVAEFYSGNRLFENKGHIWVKETFFPTVGVSDCRFATVEGGVIYRADYDYREKDRSVIGSYHWKPSIFMPRRLSRITLEITEVRVERLNEISEADAKAEGIEESPLDVRCWRDYRFPRTKEWWDNPIDSYRTLWESINGPGSWADNPWVWVLSFRRVKP